MANVTPGTASRRLTTSRFAFADGAGKKMKKHWQLYVLVFLPIAYIIIFKYVPMGGVLIAFKEYNVVKGIWESPWVGFKYFEQFLNSPYFWNYIRNTIVVSLYGLLVGFPAPILLALFLNEIKNGFFKKTVQMVTYAPYFISTVIMVSIIIVALSPNVGMVNNMLRLFGLEGIDFMGRPELFKSIYVWSDVWQFTGYGAIIYIAALSGVNPDLYEAAKVDGATRFQKIWNIDLPSIFPVMVILLILNVGSMMSLGFEKMYLMQNPLNLESSEIISTYVYKVGLLNANFSFSTAIGLFNSIINLVLIVTVNAIARKLSESSLW
ncbi:ABC transporter permease [Paenibacillus apiarius]|uniref:ABC transporter permease subunit n=1 Tax=Paenibacillus apiarius TaxID=46240 RepID=A0ABT4DUN7_9BACL|nr:ABC transporter permease subunit [Paenibacillus apiarius]MBN3523381.1 sugar ABC transporter permease [Paenibacillus apiarius]MCY9514399.1 ABC transporter permease subunit [Paenibacillus apiarius]MCY9521063.1 ABC transporter permease subunit [Paenibacillus apiarius]MCY9551910.1 ABC transporter permease subunit [Paenibacillus apiarius]MCY9557797.1 ABC transporter permease subunit [Paenibacillus apiarius]